MIVGRNPFLFSYYLPTILLAWLGNLVKETSAFSKATLPSSSVKANRCSTCYATVALEDTFNVQNDQSGPILENIASVASEANDYAKMFGLTETEAAVYAVFRAIRNAEIPLGLKGEPFVLRRGDIMKALQVTTPPFDDFFTMEDFAKAVENDFLDAVRGSTDDRKGWKVRNKSL